MFIFNCLTPSVQETNKTRCYLMLEMLTQKHIFATRCKALFFCAFWRAKTSGCRTFAPLHAQLWGLSARRQVRSGHVSLNATAGVDGCGLVCGFWGPGGVLETTRGGRTRWKRGLEVERITRAHPKCESLLLAPFRTLCVETQKIDECHLRVRGPFSLE